MKPLIIITAMLGVLIAWLIAADMDSRSAPDIGWPVVRIPEPEASAYYDGRRLVNDNQRNWVDMLAEQAQVAK